jgi:hypothetical protein
MATSILGINSAFPKARTSRAKRPLAFAIAAIAVAAAFGAAPAGAGQVGNVDILTRADGRVLPVYERDGRRWIVGTPGQEYAIRVCNTTGTRVLAVMSVDGVNVVSGETASPSQAGYVLDAWECTEINGWRKSLSSIAAFYFTELPDSYAARTGRPDNVGVIGVAFFRERQQPAAWKDVPRIAQQSAAEPSTRQEAAAANADAGGRLNAERKKSYDFAADAARNAESGLAAGAPAPAPLAKIGTGHGRNEHSVVQTTRFERESATPNETIVFQYDRRENLIAMGILPPPAVARSSNPFPGWPRAPYFVPDPPQR